jgi:hypothetical protein
MGHFLENPTITGIKLLAIMYITVIYCIGGMLSGYTLDKTLLKKLYKNDEEERKKTILRQTLEIVLVTIIFGIVSYFGRNILQEIPFPLDNYKGFNYIQVSEVKSGTLFSMFMLITLTCLVNKVTIYRKTIA